MRKVLSSTKGAFLPRPDRRDTPRKILMKLERTYSDSYVALDGQRFPREDECRAYELTIPEDQYFCLLKDYSPEALLRTAYWTISQVTRGQELVTEEPRFACAGGTYWQDTYSEAHVAHLDKCSLSDAVKWLVVQKFFYRQYEYRIAELKLLDPNNI